jgi:gentisate 1,2-dioxygenase
MTKTSNTASALCAEIDSVDELIAAIAEHNCVPGWTDHQPPLMWSTPRSALKPAHWQYERMRPALVAAGRVIGTDQAERRNFILRNPAPGNQFATTRTLVGAYQSILPGERARSHKHAPHALRVILESRGSYSVVNGMKHSMETGDIVLTPGGHWHGHGHEGEVQAFWFDCLDIPLVHLLEPMAAREHPGGWEKDVVDCQNSAMRFAWKDTEARLNALDASGSATADPAYGMFGTTYTLDAPDMPTIDIKVHRVAAGWQGSAYRHNASSIYVVLQGQGRSEIGDQTFDWKFGDVMAAPMGVRLRHSAEHASVVVELTDEKLMRYCRFYEREQFS